MHAETDKQISALRSKAEENTKPCIQFKNKNIKGKLLSIDQEKAFDKVNHDFPA